MKTKILILIIVINFHCLFAQDIPYNREFQVNSYTTGYQYNENITMLSDSGFVICWQSGNYQGGGPDGSGFGIFAVIYNKDGSIRADEFQVNTFSLNDQQNPCIAQLVNDGFVICWESADPDSIYPDIYAQIFNNDGTRRGVEFRVNNYTDKFQTSPDVKGLTGGGFVVSWSNHKDNYIGSFTGYAKIYNDDGSTRTEEFRVSDYLSGHEISSRIAAISNGGFVACWVTDNRDGDDRGVFAHIFNETGSSIGNDFLVNTTTGNWQYNPSVTSLSDSGFVICWQGIDASGTGIFGQIFNDKGTYQGTEFLVNTIELSNQGFPRVSSLSDGGFVVLYQSNTNGGTNIQLFDKDGLKNGPEFSVTKWLSHAIAGFTNNGFILVWSTYATDNSDIFYKYYKKEITHPLMAFSLESPGNDLTINSINPSFIWHKPSSIRINIPWEIQYTFYIDENDDFSSANIIKSLTDTTYKVESLNPGTTYFWKVLARNIAGDSLWSSETNAFFVDWDATDIENISLNQPKNFQLYQNYPNPFNPETTIKYTLPAYHSVYNVTLKIYNPLGQLVEVLVNKQQSPGLYMVKWNAAHYPSGVYFCRIEAGKFSATQKMLLVK